MIPIRDTVRSQTYPLITHAIVAVNVIVFLLEMAQGRGLDRFIFTYGLVPARYAVPHIADYFTTGQQVVPFLTFMFLHGGFLHVLGNMWFLFIFGDNVEDRLGHGRYLVFYLACGLASGITHLALNWQSQVPTIGASGAVAGVMGAYFVLYPRAKVLTLVPIFLFLYFAELPAFLFLGIWFLFQFLSAAGDSAGVGGGVAWWAHVGGFVFGVIFLKLLEMIPRTGISRKVRTLTQQRSTPRLQVVRPVAVGDSADLYGTISVSEREIRSGVRKLVNVAHGPRKKTFFVTIPPQIVPGSTLRLKGMGKEDLSGVQGDLYLKVQIAQQ